jgi:hypothetical protein
MLGQRYVASTEVFMWSRRLTMPVALVGYLPGLVMRRIADLHAGETNKEARNAAIIAQVVMKAAGTTRLDNRLAEHWIKGQVLWCAVGFPEPPQNDHAGLRPAHRLVAGAMNDDAIT